MTDNRRFALTQAVEAGSYTNAYDLNPEKIAGLAQVFLDFLEPAPTSSGISVGPLLAVSKSYLQAYSDAFPGIPKLKPVIEWTWCGFRHRSGTLMTVWRFKVGDEFGQIRNSESSEWRRSICSREDLEKALARDPGWYSKVSEAELPEWARD